MENAPRVESAREIADRFFKWESKITTSELALTFACSSEEITLTDKQRILSFAHYAGEQMVAEALKHKPEDKDPESYLYSLHLHERALHDLMHAAAAMRLRGTPVPAFLSVQTNRGTNRMVIEEEVLAAYYGRTEFSHKPLIRALRTEEETNEYVAGIQKTFPAIHDSNQQLMQIVEIAKTTDRSSFATVFDSSLRILLTRQAMFSYEDCSTESRTLKHSEDQRRSYMQERGEEFFRNANEILKNPGAIQQEALEIYKRLDDGNERAFIDQFLKNISR